MKSLRYEGTCTLGPSFIRCNAQIGCIPKDYDERAGTGSVSKEKGSLFRPNTTVTFMALASLAPRFEGGLPPKYFLLIGSYTMPFRSPRDKFDDPE